MKFLKQLVPIAVATFGFAATLTAQTEDISPTEPRDYSTVEEARDRDSEALTGFVRSKRAISLQEKGGNMMISGDVRGQWNHMRAFSDNKRQRGSKTNRLHPPFGRHAPYATNEFEVESNLMFDYRADRTWASIRLQMSNGAGIRETSRLKGINSNRNFLTGTGSLDNLALRKAYMGYNVVEHGTSRFDVEIGRRRLYDVFDSKVQFWNFFDGVLLKYAQSFEGMTDLTAKASAFVVDFTTNHFAYVGELGFLNMMDSGLDAKYSLIDWDTIATNRFGLRHPRGAQFLNSQYTLAYNLSPDWVHYKTRLYGAFLHNSHARRSHFTKNEKDANAWYAGVTMGEVRRKNDWSVDVSYQWVQANAVPESDVSGVGRDNPRSISLYNKRWGGFANYKGYNLEGFYALTDNLTLNMVFDRIHQENNKIGHKHRSWMFQLAAIYAF